jgi:hypothetical protein
MSIINVGGYSNTGPDTHFVRWKPQPLFLKSHSIYEIWNILIRFWKNYIINWVMII